MKKAINKLISAVLILICLSLVLSFAIVVIAESNNDSNDILLGDVNGNNKLDAPDYLLVKAATFGTYELDDQQIIRADVDKNEKISAADYFLIKRILFGFELPDDSSDESSEEASKEEISNGGVVLPDDEW